ncbi:general transcription factor 3C polypeptide 5-like [Strongylocentrotus purpuratus]|uniref:Transcription factor IIIC subunit 5 HTH domain-containing protein n=1 Tax=Strongylocentrotus purpuratus TaxID=7668 RepID=A0A7M7PLN2_STRPU|nr:general transcription factor 3C polypeptide 5-like [Strongylocentrotus purpuratus]
MKVKRRYRRRRESEDGGLKTGSQGERDGNSANGQYSAEVLGVIGQKYEFPYLCDFQYLPCEHQSSGGEAESLIGKILPSAGEDISYVDKDTPSFMLPEMFSKFDKPIPYNYKAGHQLPNSKQQHEMDFRAKLIQHGRHKRTNYAHVVSTMGDFEIPKKPHPIAVEQLEAQKPGATTDEITKLFEQRPLWSRNALRCNTEISTILIKGILCVVAYYFQQGPWRGLWCRMGYDPREHPESKKYQLLDFRIRKELTDKRLKLLLKKKRMILYPHQSLKHKKGVPTPLLGSNPGQQVDHKETIDSYYIMRRGILPAYHQMFYQLCDLEDPELQAIVTNPLWHKKRPNMKTGYFEVEMFRQLRDALTQMIKDTVLEVNAKKLQQDNASQSVVPSTSTSTPETQEEGEPGEEDEVAIGEEEEEDDEEDEEELDEEGIDDEGEEMEEQDVLDVGQGVMENEKGTEKDDKDGGEESDSENEMAMEMLEFMDSSMMPS